MTKLNQLLACAVVSLTSIATVSGCAVSSPIQPAKSSRSGFDGSIYPGKTTDLSPGTPGNEQYRVFEQGATGFVPLQAVRETAEQRAEEFCKHSGRAVEAIQERDSTHFPLPGKFPRVEIIFDCIETPTSGGSNPKYSKILELKGLLDNGALTQAEFDQEKAKILSQP